MKKTILSLFAASLLMSSVAVYAENVDAGASPEATKANEICVKKGLADKALDDCVKAESQKISDESKTEKN